MAVRNKEAYNKYMREYAQRRYATDPEFRARANATNRDRYKRNGRSWKSNSPEAKRACRLKNDWGLSEELYANMIEAQNGRCACCERPPAGKRLAIDHNHTTGKIRKLLCTSCNLVVGWIENNPNRLAQAEAYLLKEN